MMTTVPNALTFSNAYLPLRQRKALASPRQEAVKENAIEIVDSFQKKSSEKSSVPTKVIVKEVPVADKTSVVLATMGFIASLGAVFGVGLLYSKMNRPNEGALQEVQTLLAPMEKKLDRLEKQLKNKAGDVELETAFSEMRRLLLGMQLEVDWLQNDTNLINKRMGVLEDAYLELNTEMHQGTNNLTAGMAAVLMNTRKLLEMGHSAGFHRSGEIGFPVAYWKSSSNSSVVDMTNNKLKALISSEGDSWTTTQQFIEGLSEEQRQNPVVLHNILKHLETGFERDGYSEEHALYSHYYQQFEEEVAILKNALTIYSDKNAPPPDGFYDTYRKFTEYYNVDALYTGDILRNCNHNISLSHEVPVIIAMIQEKVASIAKTHEIFRGNGIDHLEASLIQPLA